MSKKQMIRRRGLSAFLAMAMCFGLLPATAWAAEEGVAIDESNFPNKTFRNYIQKVFDKDNNDFFSADEIAAVTELTFQYPDDPNTGVAGITSLKGIEYFTALTSLDCSYQDLTELDLSRNTGLTSVLCYGNQLTELDLSANTQLIKLDCSSNEITHLDVSSNHNLEKLSCYHNRLTSLDLSRNNKLTYTYCDSWCPIEPDENNTINLAELDVDKTSDWVGGKVENGILTIDEGAKKVTYNYQCGNNIEMHVILHIHIYDDFWEYNANEHWKKCTNFCTDANQGMIKSPHDYKGGNTCSICGYVNAADTYAVTVEVDGHGTAGASPAFAKTDETVTLTAIPDTGYAFKTWEVIRGGVAITNDTFIMPAKPVTVKAVFQEKTAAPVISPNGGSFNDTETVTLTCDTEGAWIYYTINGVKSHYRDPFTLTKSANITAWAEKMGKADSDIVTSAFIKIVDGVAVDTFNFPDKNFRDVVKTFDTDDNNILSDTEIAAVKKIDCKGRAITNLKGIEYFTALEYLYCYDNELTELDLRRNTKLKELNCSTNRLTVKDFTTTFTLEIPTQYTVTAHGLYGGVMGITPGEDYTARYTVGAQVGLQIGKRDGFTLQGLTLEGISEEQLQWQAKDAESTTRGISFEMPAHNVTVTVNWKANGSSSGGGGGGGGGGSVSIPDTKIPTGIYEHGTVTVSPESASKGDTVTITVTPDKGYVLESLTVLDKDGKALELTDKGSGKYTFVMPAGKIMVKAVFMDDNTMLNFFTDVHAEDYYYDAVLWAAQKGITGGMSDTLFAPNAAYTRAQIVTFLWHAAGSPEPKQLSTFGDVLADAYYAKAVAWAVENGITDGMSDTTFAPGTICTRAQGVALLYRAAGNPAVSGSAAFTDVPADAYYADAAAWAEQKGITGGIGNGLFGPHNNCTRAQIVTFLYRMYQDK